MAFGDAATIHRSRRAILFGGLGALGAIAARALPGTSEPVNADTGDVMKAGNKYTADSITSVENTATSTSGGFGSLFAGVHGAADSDGSYGVLGIGTGAESIGVDGYSSGVQGIGVHAWTSGRSDQIGLLAEAMDEGYAVWAKTKNGAALRAHATGGYALQAEGVIVFDRAGSISFAKGQVSKTVSMFMNRGDTLVVATIQGDVAGTWVRGVVVSVPQQHFVIKLNRAAPKALRVGYFVIN
jgi:hypothetical protein